MNSHAQSLPFTNNLSVKDADVSTQRESTAQALGKLLYSQVHDGVIAVLKVWIQGAAIAQHWYGTVVLSLLQQ